MESVRITYSRVYEPLVTDVLEHTPEEEERYPKPWLDGLTLTARLEIREEVVDADRSSKLSDDLPKRRCQKSAKAAAVSALTAVTDMAAKVRSSSPVTGDLLPTIGTQPHESLTEHSD